MLRAGILGFGFMGNTHFGNYGKIDGVEVVAICDIDQQKLEGKGAAGNLGDAGEPLDLSGVEKYTDAKEMFEKANLDIVSVTMPTYLHKEYTIMALNAGINVLCEKPMYLNSAECDEMIQAAEKNGKLLQVGHCIRFWPDYVQAKKIIDSGKYGKVTSATFRRLSMTPNWAWDNWIMDNDRSGGAMLDLHIHDADFVQYLFGMPKSVSTRAKKGPSSGYDHIVCQYDYDDDKVITAEGGWMMSASFGFEMSFEIVLEKAVICYDCTKEPAFKVCPVDGDAFTPEFEAGDGWNLEIVHFVKAVSGEKVEQIITPEQSKLSVKLIEAEVASADKNEKVQL